MLIDEGSPRSRGVARNLGLHSSIFGLQRCQCRRSIVLHHQLSSGLVTCPAQLHLSSIFVVVGSISTESKHLCDKQKCLFYVWVLQCILSMYLQNKKYRSFRPASSSMRKSTDFMQRVTIIEQYVIQKGMQCASN